MANTEGTKQVTAEIATVDTTAIDRMAPEQFFISNAIADRSLFAEADRRLKIILQTGLIPDSIQTTAQAMTAIEFGHDLGMSVLESLRSIQVVKGNPVLKAATVGALIKKRFGVDAFSIAQCDMEACRIDVRQLDQDGKTVQLRVEFTQDDAKRAGLWGKNQWAKYPIDMLYARAISRVQKRCFQHLGSGEVWIAELVEKDTRPVPKGLGDL